MRAIDVTVAILLVLGGLTWGSIGVYGLNPIAVVFGESTDASRAVYALIGAAAFYQGVTLEVIRRRWEVAPIRRNGTRVRKSASQLE